MSKQQFVLTLLDRKVRIHTVRGIQCVRYQAIRPLLPSHLKSTLGYKTCVSFPTFIKPSKKPAIMWDNVNRTKYIRLDWLFDMVTNNQVSI